MNGVQKTWCLLAMSQFLGVALGPATGLAQDANEIRSWLIKTRQEAASFLPSQPIEISWSVELPAMSPDALSQLRREVADRPYDPRHQLISTHERRLRDGPDRILNKLRFAEASVWRLVSDHPYLTDQWADEATKGNVLWSLTQSSLSFAQGDLSPGGNTSERLASSLANIRLLLSQGLFLIDDLSQANLAVRVENSRWFADALLPTGGQLSLQGEVDNGVPAVVSITLVPSNGRSPELELQVQGIVQDPVLNRSIASLIDRKWYGQRNIFHYLGSKPQTASEIAIAAEPPDPLGTDAVRGHLSLKRVNDLRNGLQMSQVREGNDWKTFTSAGLSAHTKHFRWAGWVLAAGIVTAIAILRIRALRSG